MPPQPSSSPGATAALSPVGASNWRANVLRQSDRLQQELKSIPATNVAEGDAAETAQQVKQRIAAARAIAERPRKDLVALRDWWTGAAVETAWDDLQTARELLDLIEPEERIRAQLPALEQRLAGSSSAGVPGDSAAILKSIGDAGPISRQQREDLRALREHLRFSHDDHAAARDFRNNLLFFTLLLAIAGIALAIVEQHG
jgi:hypothetical protein